MKKAQDHTILDIAAALNVSAATVSRALNDSPSVRPETKKRISEMALQLGYRRNHMAFSLRANKTKTVGLIVPRISMHFHAEAITTMQNALYEQGYNLIISQSNDSPEMERRLVNTMYSSRVDALIVSCSVMTEDFSHFDVFRDSGIPLVFYDRVPPRYPGAMIIRGEDFNGGNQAGKHLVACGCKRVAHISGPLTSFLYRERAAGFDAALEEAGVPVLPELRYYGQLTDQEILAAIDTMFSAAGRPDAILAANDTIAIKIHQYARQQKISIPADLSLIGYSNDPRSSIISPAITTVEQFPGTFGARIAEELMKLLNGPDPEINDREILIPVALIQRETTSANYKI